MKNLNKFLILFCFSATLGVVQFIASESMAQSSYFTSRGCSGCHGAPVVATCNGCHHHGNSSLSAVTNKTSYAPGETVTVTLSGGSRSGWIKAILYDQTGAQVAASSGNASGMGGSTTFPAPLTAPAPTTAGNYTWKMAYFGNQDGTGSGDVHSEVAVNTNSFAVAAPADTTVPVVNTFTLPATATTLTVLVSAFTASDNVAVTGYLINKSVTPPAASAAGWTTTAPASVTAVAGANTFYAWAKDAAGNVSAVKSAAVTVTLPDAIVPVVTFTLPATATNLTVLVSAFTATDNVGVTGYLINKSATPPAAAAAGWTTTAPASVIAVAGANTFYAWAKDAAGNVSAVKSAAVTVTLPDAIAPVISTFTLPATATSLTVTVSSFTATDNIGVTGYLITTSSAAPTSGWLTSAPTTAIANAAGTTIFYAWVKDAAGNVSLSKSASVTITTTTADITKPTLTISALANGAYTNKPTLNISGTATDAGGLQSVTVNGQAVVLGTDGSFSTALNLTSGANTVSIVATDKAVNQQTDTRTITYDATVPLLTVTAPADNSSSAQSFITLTGTISENSTVTVTNNGGSPQSGSINGSSFSATVNLVTGINTLVITATDLAGNSSTAKRTVTYEAGNLTLSVTYPSQDITTRRSTLVLTGTIADASSKVTVTVSMNGHTYNPYVKNGAFSQKLSFTKADTYSITVTAKDAAGNTSSATRNVIYSPSVRDHDDSDSSSSHD